jgi:hypothetical protein
MKYLIIYFLQPLVTNTLLDSICSSAPCCHIFSSFFGVGCKVTRICKRMRKINYVYLRLYVLYGRQTLRRCTIFVTKWNGYKQGNTFNVHHYIPIFLHLLLLFLPLLIFSLFCVCSLFKKLNECVLLTQAFQVFKDLTFPPHLSRLFFCF